MNKETGLCLYLSHSFRSDLMGFANAALTARELTVTRATNTVRSPAMRNIQPAMGAR